MDANALRELYEEMDRRAAIHDQTARRTYVRWPFLVPSLPLKVFSSGSAPVSITVAAHNISSTGLSIVHSAFLHPRTKVIATIPLLSGQTIDIEGVVTHSSHIQGICHQAGIKFKNFVDIRTIVSLDPFEGGFVLEKVDPETLMGSILYVDNSALGQSLVRHFLRETALRLRIAENFDQAKPIIEEGVDLIICDYRVNGQNAAEFIASLRREGLLTPVIFITSDNSEVARSQFASAQAGAILTKPVSQTLLLRSLAEYLLTGKGTGVTVSSLPSDHPGTAMLDRFIDELLARTDELNRAVAVGSAEGARTAVLQIAGIAPTMGFPTLAQFAQEADRALSATMSVEESMPQLSRLVRLCREIRAKRAA